jgi:hypothetical protein
MQLSSYLIVAIAANSLLLTSPGFAQNNPSSNPTFFTGQPPSLIDSGTPYTSVNWPTPRYYFTFDLPANSVQSLGKVTIKQQENAQTIEFNLDQTQAFQGTRENAGKKLTLKSVILDAETQTITISFDPPVSPGTTFTISLQAVANPSFSGVYQFRVTAFPNGDNPTGLDLGIGRFQFYQFF